LAIPEQLGRRILVVDDDESVSATLRRVLALDGHKAEIVSGSSEALMALEQSKFDLVITDYEMPGMKGDRLAAEIKARIPTQLILMFTAYVEHVKSLTCPVDLILGKPCGLGELREAVNKLLGIC